MQQSDWSECYNHGTNDLKSTDCLLELHELNHSTRTKSIDCPLDFNPFTSLNYSTQTQIHYASTQTS